MFLSYENLKTPEDTTTTTASGREKHKSSTPGEAAENTGAQCSERIQNKVWVLFPLYPLSFDTANTRWDLAAVGQRGRNAEKASGTQNMLKTKAESGV